MTIVKVLVSLFVLGSVLQQSSAAVSDTACTMNSDCDTTAGIAHSECDGSNCQCSPGYKDDGMDMCTAKVLGDPCISSKAECSAVTNGECSDGNCQCTAGYKQTSTTNCGKVLGNACSMASDCTTQVSYSLCNTICYCVSGYKEVRDLCSKVLGNSCSMASDCTSKVNNSRCDTNCECATGFTEVNNLCSEDSAGQMIRSTAVLFAALMIVLLIQYNF